MPVSDRKTLRQQLREARRALSPRQQRLAAMGLKRQLATLDEFQFSSRIAAYIPCDGEIDPRPLFDLAWHRGKSVYLPILHPCRSGHLLFVKYRPDDILAKNRFGIPEPVFSRSPLQPPWTLDLVLAPLVGFDTQGSRMGMGGGFYDRTFSFINKNLKPRRPHLIGLAHECQKVPTLHNEHWDISMSRVVSDTRVYRVN